jgi:hypothetical protein
MADADADEVLDRGLPGLIDFPPRGRALIVDEETAWDTPCLRRELKHGGALYFSRGARGPLDEEQQARYCSAGVETLNLTAEQEERLERFAKAARHCHGEVAELPHGEEMEPYLSCMQAELRRRDAATTG